MELVKRIRLSIDFANHLLEVNKSLQDKNLIDAVQVITNLVDELIYQGKLNYEHNVLFERMENYLENDNDLPMLGLEALKVALKDKITRSYGGKKRAMNNEAHVKLNQIVLEYLERYQASGLLKQRGRLEQFYNEMAIKHDVDYSSIKQRIGKLRRRDGHSNRSKDIQVAK